MKKILFCTFICFCSILSAKNDKRFIEENIRFAEEQIGKETALIEESGKFLNPCTTNDRGEIVYIGPTDWRSGFFPGSIWYLYELSGNEKWLPLARKYTRAIEEAKNYTGNHDVGFMIGCSFGNGLRLTKDESYKPVIIQAARSLSTRFRPDAGVIQSWNVSKNDSRGWECPVIIDNMMNLEILFEATQLSGDSSFWKIAISHADNTLREQFRSDGSCYHVIDYDPSTGAVRNRHTAQGYAHESVWSRGQAWAIYGYTLTYRYTGDKKYLDQALKTFRFMANHKNLDKDLIPYWDMDAPKIPNEKRDVSSASIIASALYEISTYVKGKESRECIQFANKVLQTLASPAYRATLGTNGHFLLMHSVGSLPHKAEVDKPLNYADYYFLEALQRKRNLGK